MFEYLAQGAVFVWKSFQRKHTGSAERRMHAITVADCALPAQSTLTASLATTGSADAISVNGDTGRCILRSIEERVRVCLWLSRVQVCCLRLKGTLLTHLPRPHRDRSLLVRMPSKVLIARVGMKDVTKRSGGKATKKESLQGSYASSSRGMSPCPQKPLLASQRVSLSG